MNFKEIFSLQRFQIKVGSSEEFKDSLTLLFIGSVSCSVMSDSVSLWMVALQAPLSMEFFR